MRVLPDVVGVRSRSRGHRLLAAGTMIAAGAALAGCSQFDAALGQREAVVTFTDGATLANVIPQPLPSDMNSPYALAQVIYQINQASDADVAVLETCLSKFPTVAGISLQDSSDQGN
jgi:hypothetical protein